METPNRIILYFEDESQIAALATLYLREAFPDFQIVAGLSDLGDSGLLCLLETTNLKSLDEVIARLAIVTTDGNLGAVKGWEIAKILRERGFRRPILYTGTTELPEEFKQYYNSLKTPKEGKGLVSAIEKYLPAA